MRNACLEYRHSGSQLYPAPRTPDRDVINGEASLNRRQTRLRHVDIDATVAAEHAVAHRRTEAEADVDAIGVLGIVSRRLRALFGDRIETGRRVVDENVRGT